MVVLEFVAELECLIKRIALAVHLRGTVVLVVEVAAAVTEAVVVTEAEAEAESVSDAGAVVVEVSVVVFVAGFLTVSDLALDTF